VSDITVKIKADNQASRVLNQVDAQVKKAAGGWRSKFASFTDSIRGMFGGGPIQNALAGLLNKIGPIGSAIGLLTTAMAVGISKAGQFADSIKDSANATGLSFQAFQRLAYVAGENGIKMERLTAILNKFQNSQNEIASNKQIQQAYKKLGLSIDEVAASRPDELLQKVAKGFRETGDIGALYDIFGKGAGEVKMMLADLAAAGDMKGIIKGNIVSDEALTALNRLTDGFNNLKRSAGSALTEIAGQSVMWAQGIKGFWDNVFSGQGMAKSADLMGNAQADATQKVMETKAAEEEAAAAARQRAVDEAKAEDAKKQIKEDNAKLDKMSQLEAQGVGDDQARIAKEQKNFEGQLQALGRKRQDIFDPRGDMGPEELQKEQAGRILNTRSDMRARRADRDAERTRKRMERLAEQAQFVEARGGKASRRGRMAMEFMQRQFDIAGRQRDIEKRKEQAEQAQIRSEEIMRQIRERNNSMLEELEGIKLDSAASKALQAKIDENTKFLRDSVSIRGGS
jgi:hypothetical protein